MPTCAAAPRARTRSCSPTLANALKSNKLHALEAHRPDVIATANIGCMTHLQSGTGIPIRHWIELLDDATSGSAQARRDATPIGGAAAAAASASVA